MNNAISINLVENIGFAWKYIDAILENDFLTILTTDEFKYYEERETSTQIILTIRFTCASNSRSVYFLQPINIANNHDPVFSELIYEITVPLPLPRSFDLTFFQVGFMLSL